MRELPILMNGPMVRAVLDGRKTVTRRMVKPTGAVDVVPFVGANNEPTGEFGWCPHPCHISQHIRCPYGHPGDRLWVRETFMRVPHPAEVGLTREMLPHTWDEACAVAGTHLYKADDCSEILADGRRWTPSIHMPRAASRITLEVTGVHVERLCDISNADAVAEGVNRIHHGDGAYYFSAMRNEPDGKNWSDPVFAFQELWEQINGPGSWDANPWIWVVEFKRIEQERTAA